MELNTILNLLNTYHLTADELLLIYLTFLAREEEGHPEYFVRWFDEGGKDRLRDLFNSIKAKGLIHKDYNPESYVPDDIEFNKTFEKSWLKTTMELGQELFDEYPPFLYIGGKMMPIKNIAKRFGSLEEFFFFYSSQIKHNPEKHAEIMELLKWGKENNRITFGICEFVISHKWEELRLLKEGKIEGEIASTFEAYDTV